MSKELKERFENAKSKFSALDPLLNIASKIKEMESLKKESLREDFWQNPQQAQKIMKECGNLQGLLTRWDEQTKNLSEIKTILELLEEESEHLEFLKEAEEKMSLVEKGLEDLEFQRMLSGKHDNASAILFINAGAGGTEACDWAEMLTRMYRRWADKKGFKNEVVDFTPGEGAGLRSVVLTIDGSYAYGYLKAEIGVHRLVRISPFDANKRRHTSFASVFVLPDVEQDIEIEIKEADLRIDTFRAGGAGGQHVNKTESAIRITHVPTGIVVACRNERSQHQNRATAMKLLKAKLYEAELEKRAKEREAEEETKKKIEWGSQIRSYVMQPYQMVKDHRTQLEVGDVTRVMDGDIDPFIHKYLLQ